MAGAPKYTVARGAQFTWQFRNLPEDFQDAVITFTDIYEIYGLSDFNNYPGKIKYSWDVPSDDPKYLEKVMYARQNKLWHYHVGLPEYKQGNGNYKVSEWVLHFRWDNDERITLLDLCEHNDSTGRFRLPPENYLACEEDSESS